jgi:hypothetical protein
MYFFNFKSLQAATLKTFKSLERNELIFFWHHVQVNNYTVVYVLLLEHIVYTVIFLIITLQEIHMQHIFTTRKSVLFV